MPLFAAFFTFLLFFFRIMEVQLIVQNALEETGRTLAVISVKELEEPETEIGYLTLGKGMLYLKLKDESAVAQFVSGGAAGVSLLKSEFAGDYIVLKANYVMRFPVKLFGNHNFLMSHITQFRKWNGWHSVAEHSEDSELVYVTEYGEVYHMRLSCPYLRLSIQKISYSDLKEKRNHSGETYEACELCALDGNFLKEIYITDYGDRYHRVLDCGGLKRTIYQKRLSEIGGMPACAKCSK